MLVSNSDHGIQYVSVHGCCRDTSAAVPQDMGASSPFSGGATHQLRRPPGHLRITLQDVLLGANSVGPEAVIEFSERLEAVMIYLVKYWTREVASRSNDSTQLAWLYNIFEQSSASRFPNLTTIVLEECYLICWGDWKRMDVAALHPKVANHKIRVVLRVLVPKEMVVECLDVLRSFGFTGGIDTSVEDADMAD